MLLVASETGHVYTFATRKLQPMITSDAGKALIQTCLNSPDLAPGDSGTPVNSGDQRMSATGYEETELTYNVADDEQEKIDPHLGGEGDDEDVEEDGVEIQEEEEEEEEEEQDFQEFIAREAEARTARLLQQQPRLEAIVAARKTAQKVPCRQSREGPSPSPSSSSLQIVPIMKPPMPSTLNRLTAAAPPTNARAIQPQPVTMLSQEVAAQLVPSGHFVREDGTLVRFATPTSSSASTSEVVVSLTTPAAPSTSSSLSAVPLVSQPPTTRKRRRK